MSNNITAQIETVGLSDTNYGSTLNERLETINDNFDAIVNSNLLKGEPGTSIITEKKSFDSNRNAGIYDGKIHRWIAEIICGAQSVDPDGNSYYDPEDYDVTDPFAGASGEVVTVMNNIKDKFIILQYENASTTDQALVSCIPFVYIDPKPVVAPDPDDNDDDNDTYTDLSCTVYYDVTCNSFVKEHNFPTLYYDASSSLFKWRIHGQNTELVAKGPAGADGVNGNMMLVKYDPDNYKITGVWMNDLDLSQNYTGSWVEEYQPRNPNARNGDVIVGFPNSISDTDLEEVSTCVVSTLIKGTDSWYIAQPKANDELASIYRIAIDKWLENSLDAIGTDGFVDGLYVPMRESDTLTIAPTQRGQDLVHMIKPGEIDNVVAGKTLNIKYDNVNLGGTVNGGVNFVSETDWKKLSIPTTRDEFESIVARLVLVKYEGYGEEMYRYSGKVEYNNTDYYSFTCSTDVNQMFLYSDFHEGWRECNLYRIIQDKIEDDYDENNPIYTPGLVIYEDGIYTGRTEHIKDARLYNLSAEAIYSNGIDVGLTKIRDKGDWSTAPQVPSLLPGNKASFDEIVKKMILRKSSRHINIGYDFYHFSGIDRYKGRNFYKFISDTDLSTSLLFSEYDEGDFTQGKLYKLIKEKTEGRTAGDFSSNIKNADIIIMGEGEKGWENYGDCQIEDIYITDTPSLFTECLRAPLISTSRLIVDGEVITASTANVSYDYLKKMRDGGTLTPGHFYRITDYATTTIQTDTHAVNHPFDVIVLALSNNKLSEEAWAMHSARDTNEYFAESKLEAWKLWYCIDNDTDRFAWADTANGKGVIYRMIDEFGNDLPYDFKNIVFMIPSTSIPRTIIDSPHIDSIYTFYGHYYYPSNRPNWAGADSDWSLSGYVENNKVINTPGNKIPFILFNSSYIYDTAGSTSNYCRNNDISNSNYMIIKGSNNKINGIVKNKFEDYAKYKVHGNEYSSHGDTLRIPRYIGVEEHWLNDDVSVILYTFTSSTSNTSDYGLERTSEDKEHRFRGTCFDYSVKNPGSTTAGNESPKFKLKTTNVYAAVFHLSSTTTNVIIDSDNDANGITGVAYNHCIILPDTEKLVPGHTIHVSIPNNLTKYYITTYSSTGKADYDQYIKAAGVSDLIFDLKLGDAGIYKMVYIGRTYHTTKKQYYDLWYWGREA